MNPGDEMRHKNKLVLAVAGLAILLFAAGALLIVNLRGIAAEALQTSLFDFSKQAVQTVRTETQGNLNVLSALSDLDAFSDSKNSPDKDSILNRGSISEYIPFHCVFRPLRQGCFK